MGLHCSIYMTEKVGICYLLAFNTDDYTTYRQDSTSTKILA